MKKFSIIYKKPKPIKVKLEPLSYNASSFGIKGKCSGHRTSFAIIGSGLPNHKDITEFLDIEVFVEKTTVPDDLLGLSTMYAGIITSNSIKGMTGFTPKTKPLYVKAINERKETSVNSLVSSILWSIIKKTDVAILTFLPKKRFSYIEEVLRKAYMQNVCLFVHESNVSKEWEDNPHIMIVRSKEGEELKLDKENGKIMVSTPNNMYTTYLNNKYVIAREDILSTSTIAGLALVLIQKNKNSKTKYTPLNIYEQLLNL